MERSPGVLIWLTYIHKACLVYRKIAMAVGAAAFLLLCVVTLPLILVDRGFHFLEQWSEEAVDYLNEQLQKKETKEAGEM